MFSYLFPRPLAVVSALILALVVGLAGCGRGPAVGQVSGTVTFERKPVTEGRVSFQNLQTGEGFDALLDKEGAFAIATPLPVGEYKVIVFPLVVREKADPRGPVVGVEKPAPNIPEKYRTIGTTDLKATVKEGKNDLTFNMRS